MSKVIRVIVLCPNGRRETISLSSNSSILQILEEACQKQKLNPDDFDICHYKKPLDLTLPIRFANLSNNAQLELQAAKSVRKDSLVTIGLQLESGERILKDFVPSSSVWDVMEKCLSMQSGEKVEGKGEPVCIYMRQKIFGKDLKNTTLRGLGLTKGSAVIRLLYRNPEDLSDQAHVSTPLTKPQKQVSENISENTPYDNPVECDQSVIKQEPSSLPTGSFHENSDHSSSASQKQSITEDFVSPVSKFASPLCHEKDQSFQKMTVKQEVLDVNSCDTAYPIEGKGTARTLASAVKEVPHQKLELGNENLQDKDTEEEEEIGAIHYVGGRHAVIYSLDDITEVKKADLPDEFFELTIEDVKFLMQEYKRTRLELENKPLLTKELKDRQVLKKLGCYKHTVIRVYFPERLVLQAVFEVGETVQDVSDFIRNYLEDQSLNFYLYTTPPKEKKDPSKSLIEAMLIPAAVVYFGSEKSLPSYLICSLRDKISDPRAAALAAHESRKQAWSAESEPDETEVPTTSWMKTVQEYKTPGPCVPQTSSSTQSSEKVPKWLKLSKK